MKIMPLYGDPIGTADVKVEETAERMTLLDGDEKLFDLVWPGTFKRKNAQLPVFFS